MGAMHGQRRWGEGISLAHRILRANVRMPDREPPTPILPHPKPPSFVFESRGKFAVKMTDALIRPGLRFIASSNPTGLRLQIAGRSCAQPDGYLSSPFRQLACLVFGSRTNPALKRRTQSKAPLLDSSTLRFLYSKLPNSHTRNRPPSSPNRGAILRSA